MKKILIILTTISISSLLFAENWTKWRGPNANGTSSETTWNPEALLGDPEILWEMNVGKGHSQCAVFDEKLYTCGTIKKTTTSDTLFEDIVWCVDAETGDEIWTFSYPSEDISYPGIRTSPIIEGKKLYTLSSLGDLYCFDANTGDVNWKKNLPSDYKIIRPDWGFSGSPVIYKDILLLTGGESGLALNKNNGNLVWCSNTKIIGGLSSPYLINYKNKTYAIIGNNDKIYCVDVVNGDAKWEYKINSENDPIYLDGKLFLSGDNRIGCVMLQLTDAEPKELWKTKKFRGGFQNKVIVGDYAYGFGPVKNKDHLHCISLEDGKLQWTKDMGAHWGALMASNNKLIIINGMGKVTIAEASPEGLEEISFSNIISMADNKGIPRNRQCHCWIDPIMANGNIYVRNNYGNLVCIDATL